MRLTMRGKNGSLNQFTQKVKNKSGEVIEYPKINGIRDPDNPQHWRWHFTYKGKDKDGKYRTHTLSVRPQQVEAIKVLILGNVQLEAILAYLKSSK
ncbi:MAG: hypothetical protein LH613_17350 [Chamaesiphon sp.]|nr:hypothetical protein [Chamaesiphon sp.]